MERLKVCWNNIRKTYGELDSPASNYSSASR